jgi:hypothetical protein
MGLKLSSRPGFDVSPQIPNADAMVIIPGNQRIRVLDFSTKRCRVFLKEGFDSATMANEIRLRGNGNSGPFPPITSAADNASWFEEALLDAYALPRCPPAIDKSVCEKEALKLLEEWQRDSKRTENAKDYSAQVLAKAQQD